MGNHQSASHTALKPRKNVHWKSAGRPAVPGKPDIIPVLSDEEPNAVTLRWAPPIHDGGAPLHGYQVQCNRLGSTQWVRTQPPLVLRPELLLTGLEAPHRYQFRVAAVNAVGRSDYGELSDVLTVSFERGPQEPPLFLQHLQDVTVLENEETEFHVAFSGTPTPTIAWFKDDYEIFSSRRTAISTNDSSSVLVFHQTLPSDEGEIKCTATNRAGHAVTKARLSLEAAPKLRYPRQYEDGLLYEINETVFLKTTIVGKPTPMVEWRHDGHPIMADDRIEICTTPKFSVLKIHMALRTDRGEYQVHARNSIGEDTAAFLVTITAPPEPPQHVSVTRQVDKSVTLAWEPPEDDGGCRIGNYIVEYYRSGWNVWLKATTSRKTSVTLYDLIEGSEYRFRVKAESPYGMSTPSVESPPVKIPGRAVDMEFLAVESRIINDALKREDGEEGRISPAPRRKKQAAQTQRARSVSPSTAPQPQKDPAGSHEFMLVLYPDNKESDKSEKRKSFQLDLEDALSPPPLSLSAPELSARCVLPFKALRNAVSSTELLHEAAMARFYKAVAMKEDQDRRSAPNVTHIPHTITNRQNGPTPIKPPEIVIKQDSVESGKLSTKEMSKESVDSEHKWPHTSFDEDYTASTVSTDGDYSEEGSLNGGDRNDMNEEDTYNPRDKTARSPLKETVEEEEEFEREILKPLPLPDPNFVPKPILKRRDIDVIPPKSTIDGNGIKLKEIEKPMVSKKEEKMTIFRKLTKMPTQKSFPFPRILNKTKEPEKKENSLSNNIQKIVEKENETLDKVIDEGKTVIDYYGSIVKEFGSQKKAATPLYLNTEELKCVAEKQQLEAKDNAIEQKKVIKTKRSAKFTENKTIPKKTKKPNSKNSRQSGTVLQNAVPNIQRLKSHTNTDETKIQNLDKSKIISKTSHKSHESSNKGTQQILLKTERATIVIPIDYQELEKKAKVNVRSAIDYAVDMCLLLVAFWVYFFKDERLAIPLLLLIIYRQVQETLFEVPNWVQRYTPGWLKKKAS
ncbi:hypothetical protein ACJJTC_000912 [Scirpophaga incertulas]